METDRSDGPATAPKSVWCRPEVSQHGRSLSARRWHCRGARRLDRSTQWLDLGGGKQSVMGNLARLVLGTAVPEGSGKARCIKAASCSRKSTRRCQELHLTVGERDGPRGIDMAVWGCPFSCVCLLTTCTRAHHLVCALPSHRMLSAPRCSTILWHASCEPRRHRRVRSLRTLWACSIRS